jgi:hypothetical protein
MKRYPFVAVQAFSSSATTPITYVNAIGLPFEFHIVSFTAEVGSNVPSGFQWNFKLHGSQKYFFYQDFSAVAWGTTAGYLLFKLPGEIVLPPSSIIDILYTASTSTPTSGQLLLIGYLQ